MSKTDKHLEIESLNTNYNDDETLLKDLMSQKIETKKDFDLPIEISHKIKEITNMFNKNFGKSFLNKKPEYLVMMEKLLQKYLFDPDSKFLNKLPSLQKKLRIEKKLNEELLTEKINMGEMVFYNLRDTDNKNVRISTNSKEKLFSLSKNFSSKIEKDVVSNQFYKIKFWDRNSKRINKLISKSVKSTIKTNISNKANNENEVLEKNNINNTNYNDESIEDFLMKNCLSDNRNPSKIEKYSLDSSPNLGTGGYKRLFFVDKNETNSYNKLFLSNNSNNKYENRNVPKNYKLKINNNKHKNSFSPFRTSYNGFKGFAPKSNFLNTNYNYNKTMDNYSNRTHKIKFFSPNIQKIFKNTDFYNLLESSSRLHPKKINRVLEKIRIFSTQFKSKFNNKISDLNKHTYKCNNQLYKLIDGNNIENLSVKERVMLNKNKIDLKEILFGDDKPKKKKNNVAKNESIKSIVKNITDEEENKKNQIILRKKINDIPDDLALEMVEHSVRNKRREFNLKEILKDSDGKKAEIEEKRLENSRKKLEINYHKMIRLQNNIFYEQAKILSGNKKKSKEEKIGRYNFNNRGKNFKHRQTKLKKCFSGGNL